jgi:hypothetical protein
MRLLKRKIPNKIRLNLESLKCMEAMLFAWISETLKGLENDKGFMN